MAYTTKVLTLENLAIYEMYLYWLVERYGKNFPMNLGYFDLRQYTENARVLIVLDDDTVMGVYLAQVYRASLDPTKRICYQDLMWARSPRAFKMLMTDFIDFGRKHADHIISMVGPTANLKDKSMRKLGFTPIETLYRIEV